MPDNRVHDVSAMTDSELERARRHLMVSLSLNLGLLNLFPIPLLDGGHLAFYAIEAVRGRPLGERAQEWGLRIGVALVLGLVVLATWNDLVVMKVIDYLKNLVT
jgi:regulator of sigma E protease